VGQGNRQSGRRKPDAQYRAGAQPTVSPARRNALLLVRRGTVLP
jgi:hypothetical protein